jgi:hypothetical protein
MRRICCLARLAVLLIAVLPGSVTGAQTRDALSRAKDLYHSAAYDEALALLDGIGDARREVATEVAQYRAFCLLALDRRDEARQAIERIVNLDPFYLPSDAEASPRIRSVFQEIRRGRLPRVVQQSYAEAKSAFDRSDPDAYAQFDRVLALLDDPDMQGTREVADLRLFTMGFRDLVRAAARVATEAALKTAPAPATLAPPPADATALAEAASVAGSPRPVTSAPAPAPAGSVAGFAANHIELPVRRVTNAPALADILSADAAGTTVITDFRQNQPGDGLPVSLPTIARLSYDADNLYVIFECRDDPSNVRAHLATRENIGSDDRVVLYLDTFRDRRRAYVFEVNPLGVQRDGILTEGQDTDYSYDSVWSSEGTLTKDGFVVLVTIPFRSLRFSSDDTQTWGIALGRYIQRNSEESYWPAITARVAGFVSQMGVMSGLRNMGTRYSAQVVPYGAVTASRYLDPKTPAFVRGDDGRGGFDAKLATRNGITVDFTVNPDFSQVESDKPQVTVNKRFEVIFPEKRPFFIENAGYFHTPEAFVFSRRIVDPQFGARLTGKSGKWAFGALVADDRVHDTAVPADRPSSGSRAGNAIVRVQREVGSESLVGVLATDRELGSSFNRLFAVDTRLKLSPTWIFTGQAARSDTETLAGIRQHGSAVSAEIKRSGRDFSYASSFRDLSPGFDAALGYTERVDLRETSHRAGYYRHLDRGPVTSVGPSVGASMDWDHAGERQDWSVTPGFELYFRRQVGVTFYHSESWERFEDIGFRKRSDGVSAYSSQSKIVSVSGSFSWGVSPNYSPPDGSLPALGTSRSASFSVSVKPSQRVRLDQTYYFSQLRTNPGAAAGALVHDVFANHISRTTASLQVTKALSLRGIMDYNTLVTDASLISQDLTKTLTGDFLVTYLVNPFTALYLGYTEGRRNLAIDPTQPQTLRVLTSPSTPALRQVFVKMSYRLGL